jgi:DNA-binding response OmpR family regulator
MTFPDLADYRIILVDDRAEITAMIAEMFSAAGAELIVATAIDAAARLIQSSRPNLVLVATAITGEPFAVVDTAKHNDVPVMALDLGSVGPEISDRLGRTYGVDVVRNVDEPEALCHAAKRAADRATVATARGVGRWR